MLEKFSSMQQLDLIGTFVTPLENIGIPYLVTGSVASMFYGEPRLTHDIDLVILLRTSDIAKFASCFPIENFYCPPPEVITIEIKRSSHAHFNLIHHQSGLKADCYLYVGDTLHDWAFEHQRRIILSDTISFSIAPPEYVIIRKLQYFKEGESTKHLRDIKKMLETDDSSIDQIFVSKKCKELNLDEEWARVTTGRIPS